jgi:DNA helicase-4
MYTIPTMTITGWFILALVVITVIFALLTYKIAQARRYAATRRLSELETPIRLAMAEWHSPEGKDQYLTHPQHRRWEKACEALINELRPILRVLAGAPRSVEARELVALWDGKEGARVARNDAWVKHQQGKHDKLFTGGLGYPLNSDQIDAILYDEHRALVVAGAGTGKTSTIVAKARWILAQGLTAPSRIRMLAFNKKAAEEIGERLGEQVSGAGISSTFHSLGLDIVAQARGKKPRLTSLDEDIRVMQTFLRKCIDEGLKTPNVANHVIEFLAYFRYPEPNPVPVEESHEANRWAEGHDIRSLTGVLLRSNSEAIIANWLTLNGIQWKYEANYELDTATIQHGQYRPDFYLPEYRIYIEHWACDQNGQFSPSWSPEQQARYREGMAWKRELHGRQETLLVETYSHVNSQRTIIETLERTLIPLGVTPTPLSDEERNALVTTDDVINPVVKLTQNFLKLYRESGASLSELRVKLECEQSAREQAFLNMFEWVEGRYVNQIESEGAIDFSDMIREAATALREQKVHLPLDYLLVDEFQDISRGRAQLIKAILEQNPSCRLVAVGDDWQSINRFAGSDIQVMVDFEHEFGFTKRTDLRQTHRFGTKLLDATSKFIQMNPQQLKKSLIAARMDQYPAVEVLSTACVSGPIQETHRTEEAAETGEDSEERMASAEPDTPQPSGGAAATALSKALLHIADTDENASVLVLGRYRFLKQRIDEAGGHPSGLKIEFSTVHSAKGREADYVVIVDVVAGKYGFPSEIEDDPIMNLVLAAQAGYPNAEERRLFYVALTRARMKSYVLSDDHRRSSFVDELEAPEYEGLVIGSGAAARIAKCPVCEGGRLQLRAGGQYGPFYACTSQRCSGKAAKCPHCGAGGFLRGPSKHTCLFCGKTADNCPKCTRGYLKHIPGGVTYQAFDACSTNRKNPPYRCYVRNPCGCQTETTLDLASFNQAGNFHPTER